MIERRGIMRLLGGLPLAAVGADAMPKVSVKQVMDYNDEASAGPGVPNPDGFDVYDWVHEMMRSEHVAEEAQRSPLPPHIAGKKSWSQAFKVSEFEKELMALRLFRERAQKDGAFRAKVAGALGIELPEALR